MTQDVTTEPPKLSDLKFLVTSVLGTGPGGTVMIITDRHARTGVYALRVVKREGPRDDLAIEHARAETEAAKKLDHPAILKVLDFRLCRSWFRVSRAEQLMEYVEGKALDALGEIGIGPAVLVFHRAAAALAAAHRKGVVHGDLRPSRILLARTGQVKVRGFGLPRIRDGLQEQIKADRNYAAPERLKDRVVDTRGDLYGLGATMYRVLTGQHPVSGAEGRVEGRKISTPIALNSQIPGPLNDLIVSCLLTDPTRRPASMFEVARTLEGLVADLKLRSRVLQGLAAQPS